jgi:hypothetical protein
MAHFSRWKSIGCLAAAAVFLGGCRRSTSPTPAGTAELASPAVPHPSITQEVPVAADDPRAMPGPRAENASSPVSQGKNQLHDALTQYSAADEETRTHIEEHISELADTGVAKRDIATALGTMFTLENSIEIKCSILDELYQLQDPSVLEYVTDALSPNQPLEVRDQAISILKDIGDKGAISFLWPLLADPDETIREEAQDAIEALGHQDAK